MIEEGLIISTSTPKVQIKTSNRLYDRGMKKMKDKARKQDELENERAIKELAS